MSIIAEIVERLRVRTSSSFRVFGLAADMAAVKDSPLAVPAIYVFVKEENSEPNARVNSVYQRTALDVGVMIITTNLGDAQGGATAGDIEDLKIKVRRALVGWQPPSAADAIENIGGQIVKAAKGTVWWEHVVGTAFYINGDDAEQQEETP